MRGWRSFHAGRLARKVTATKSNVPDEVATAAQALRLQLHDEYTTSARVESLVGLASAVDKASGGSKIPPSVYRLMRQAMKAEPNYRLNMNVHTLQLLFRSVVKTESKDNNQLDLATALYADIHRHSKVDGEQRLHNGIVYYEFLRKTGLVDESEKLVEALLKSNVAVLTPESVLALLQTTSDHQPSTSSILAIIEACPTGSKTVLNNEVISFTVQQLVNLKSVEGLDQLATYIYFTSAHLQVSEQTTIVVLDAFLQLPLDSKTLVGGGSKVLKLCLGNAQPDTPLETLELLLMSCIHFQEPAQTNSPAAQIHNLLVAKPSSEYTKETWDILAQWSAYQSSSGMTPLDNLKKDVLPNMPAKYTDCKTLVGVLVAASEKGQCSESQASEIVEYFDVELGVTPDASVFKLLIKRSLQAFEINRARTLFIQSNSDWNIDNDAYADVLSELLVALCRTPSIPRQTVMDTYKRVQVFTPQVSYEAQLALLEMFLHESTDNSTVPAGIFVAEQFGEIPNLPYESHKEIFDLMFHRLLAESNEERASEMCVLLNSTIVIPYEAYFPICQKMCALDRPDVAHLFFRQLRKRTKGIYGTGAPRPPGEELYLMLFAEYSKAKYELGISELDTFLRLDVNNEMTVPILNRMLAGYSALHDSHKVAHLWTEISSLPKGGIHGPNDETMCIWMQFLSRNIGLPAVDDVWETLASDFKVKPSVNTLKQYIIANCYHGHYTRALDVVKMAREEYGLPVTTDILESLYNWTMLPTRKDEVREYAMEAYPLHWAQLEAKGSLKNILLPAEDETGDTDEYSRRWAAIKQLEDEEETSLLLLK